MQKTNLQGEEALEKFYAEEMDRMLKQQSLRYQV